MANELINILRKTKFIFPTLSEGTTGIIYNTLYYYIIYMIYILLYIIYNILYLE